MTFLVHSSPSLILHPFERREGALDIKTGGRHRKGSTRNAGELWHKVAHLPPPIYNPKSRNPEIPFHAPHRCGLGLCILW